MGVKDWRARRGMKDPVRGEFRVSDSYYPHPGRTPIVTMLTGILVADGIKATPAEHQDHHSIGWGRRVLPALIDRADPTRSVILWDEIPPVDERAEARQRAVHDAEALRSGPPSAPAAASVTNTVVTGLDELPSWLQKAVGAALDGDGEPGQVTVQYGDGPVLPLASPGTGAQGRGQQAVLVAVTDVPVPAYALPSSSASLCDLTLQLVRPDGSSYRVETRMGFRNADRRSRLARLGSPIPVHVDAADETLVSIDLAAWDASTR